MRQCTGLIETALPQPRREAGFRQPDTRCDGVVGRSTVSSVS
jgi:hypothetical protein